MEKYNKYASPPDWAKKEIQAGRLKGKTDINPQWRIQSLTEEYGSCGIGWYYEETKREFIEATSNETAVFVSVSLYIRPKDSGEWSKPIIGTGGSMFKTMEKNGLHVSDEAVKMATTDALSVCCKMLGIGGAVYSGSKYVPVTLKEVIPPKPMEDLTPSHPLWDQIKESVRTGKRTPAQLREKFKLSAENEALLINK